MQADSLSHCADSLVQQLGFNGRVLRHLQNSYGWSRTQSDNVLYPSPHYFHQAKPKPGALTGKLAGKVMLQASTGIAQDIFLNHD
jgi:hypothetical protein